MLSILQLRAEGTAWWMPLGAPSGQFKMPFDASGGFSSAQTDSINKIYIYISDTSERILYGFYHKGNASDQYQIKDPNGNIIYGPVAFPLLGSPGSILAKSQAQNGPKINGLPSNGYNPLIFNPKTTGNYTIEYIYGIGTYSSGAIYEFDYTVINKNKNIINGRVWSPKWGFSLFPDRKFNGKFYIYTSDSIVTQIDFVGSFKPIGFAFGSNSTGTTKTGNIIYDRQSKDGSVFYSEYPIFINEPDSNIWPSGSLSIINSVSVSRSCNDTDSICINVNVTKAARVDIILNLNDSIGYQDSTKDVLFAQKVLGGNNCILWNGLDGQGNPVAKGKQIPIQVILYNGTTHIPLADIEGNETGLFAYGVRPLKDTLPIKWDDRAIWVKDNPSRQYSWSGPLNIGGCKPSSVIGCHRWRYWAQQTPSKSFGNDRTINSWWELLVDSMSITFDLSLQESIPALTTSFDSICKGELSTIGVTDSAIQSIIWNTGETDTQIIVSNPGTYWASIEYYNGCTGSDTVEIISKNSCDSITDSLIINYYIPNAFSPNQDNVNDRFLIRGEGITSIVLTIYDRWGDVVFKGSDPIGWDGTINGKIANKGVYVYKANIFLIDNREIAVKGNFSLIK